MSPEPKGGFFLEFGIDSNGDPTVQTSSLGPVFVLTNAGSTYNNYQLIYNATEDAASLWVNGTKELNNITGNLEYGGSWGLFWGEFQGPSSGSQANWNLVSLEATPEPSAMSLILLGSGVLIYVRKRHKRHSAQAKLE